MAFLAPFIMVVVFGGDRSPAAVDPPAALRPLMAFGAGAMMLLVAGLQLVGNQFGYDRAGFRAYVLVPGPAAGHPARQEPGRRPAGPRHGAAVVRPRRGRLPDAGRSLLRWRIAQLIVRVCS